MCVMLSLVMRCRARRSTYCSGAYPIDADRFSKLLKNPARTQQDLETMRRNAIDKGNIDLAAIATDVLNDRFPGWDRPGPKRGGAIPTRAGFRSVSRDFPSEKEAYCWLIEKFIAAHPSPFTKVNWELVFFAKGRQRNYFGRNLKKMFHASPHLAETSSNYQRLSNGWYINLNLSRNEKFEILCKFAAVGG